MFRLEMGLGKRPLSFSDDLSSLIQRYLMRKNRLKLLLWTVIGANLVVLFIFVMQGIGSVITYFGSGADPSQALKLIPIAPPDLQDRLVWLPDAETVREGRRMEPFTREQIGSAYLLGWAQWTIGHELGEPYGLKTYFSPPALYAVTHEITSTARTDWTLQQANLRHELQLNFYSDDGSIVSFTDHRAELVQDISLAESDTRYIHEWQRRYDIVMRLEDGNWRIRDLVSRGASEPTLLPTQSKGEGFVEARGDQLYLNGNPFYVAGINYYPQATPWTAFLPEYDKAQIEIDLDRIATLNLNTIRIFVSYADIGGDEVEEAGIEKLRHFLDEAEARQLMVIVTIFDHHTDHHVKHWASDDRHLEQLIPQFADHQAILAWDIKNEPDRDYGFNSPELVDAWLRHIAAKVREHDPNHMLTIGWSNPEDASRLIDIVDLISYHYFEDSKDYSHRLAQLHLAASNKPLLLQEFVMSTWNSFWPHGHTEAEQALYYADLLSQHRQVDTAGYMVWTLYDFDQVPLAEFRMPWQRATQAHMGLIRKDGSPKAASYIVQPDADLALTPLPRWHRFTKPFWLAVMCGMLLITSGVLWYMRRFILALVRGRISANA